MPESFVEGLLRRKSLPQSKVSDRLRFNVLCWCTSIACKNSIISAIVMAAAMTAWSTAILAAKSTLQIVHLRHWGLLALLQKWFMSKWWHWSKVEAGNLFIKTFKTCRFNESRLYFL